MLRIDALTGLPMDDIKLSQTKKYSHTRSLTIPMSDVGVIQSLANNDPDVDAMYRLIQPLPFSFPQQGLPCLVPSNRLSPYNAQATLHFYSALWSLLLPMTVHGRVADIWRSYIAMRLGREIGMRLLFSRPVVVQLRNSHDYMADFDSEDDLYKKSSTLVSES